MLVEGALRPRPAEEPWSFVPAPPGKRAQPQLPRNLTLSASGLQLPLPDSSSSSGNNSPLALGRTLLEKHLPSEALHQFKLAARASPGAVDPWYGAAIALYELEKDVEAASMANHALDHHPQHAPSHLLLAFLHLQGGRFDQSRTHLQAFLNQGQNPSNAEAIQGLLEQVP